MQTSWRELRGAFYDRKTLAYHEAAHAVIAYEFGWWVYRGGVRISGWPHASLWCDEPQNTARARICIDLAGLLAEEKLHRTRWHFEEDIIKHLQAARAGKDGQRMYPSDLHDVALALLEDDPPISIDGARGVITYWRNETNALLGQPRIWAGIERLAKALLRRRYLSPRAVREVLGGTFFVAKAAL